MEKYSEIRNIAQKYLDARKRFIRDSEKIDELKGNDNIIGRIGELIALEFLHRNNRKATKNKNLVEKGYDIRTDDGEKVSVKIITSENKKGRTTKLKKPWTEIIIISLNSNYKVDRIGHITEIQFTKAFNEGFIKSLEPYTDRKMLSDNNLFSKYGHLYKDNEVSSYL